MANTEVKATAKYVRVAPRKARMVVDMIRNKSVAQALEILQFSNRAAAVDVAKVVRSAAANAEAARISSSRLASSTRVPR